MVLCYHNILPDQAFQFEKQLKAVSDRVVSLHDHKLTSPLIKPAVIITFDDAYSDLLNTAIPVLTKLDCQATIFVVAGCMGMEPTWLPPNNNSNPHAQTMKGDEIKSISQNSIFTIGSHSVSHPRFSEISDREILREASLSKIILEKLTGKVVDGFAFPHGDYDQRSLGHLSGCGYRYIHTLAPAMNMLSEQYMHPHKDATVIGRFLIEPDTSLFEFRLTCDGAYAWLLIVRKSVNYLRKRLGL